MRYIESENSKGTLCTQSTTNTTSSFCDTMDEEFSRIPKIINSHAMTVKTVHSLEAELIRLRESTKDALQQSWEEVEMLQQQCSAHLDITTQLENDVIEARRKQEYWHKRCLEAEFKLLQGNKNISLEKGNNLARSISGSANVLKPMMGSLQSWTGLKIEPKEADDHSVSQMSMDHETEVLQERANEQAEKIQELEVKLANRDSTIETLERTVERHEKTMHSLKAEMQCMIETQRLKEKRSKDTFSRKENFLNEQISNFQEDIQYKDKSIKSLKKRIGGYKEYIEELSAEMETMLRVLMSAEKKGINLRSFGQ